MEDNLHLMAAGTAALRHTGFPEGTVRRGRGAPLSLELEELLTPRPENTYLFRVAGYTWADQGIVDGDIAVVDRALDPGQTDLVVSWRDSGFAIIKRHQLEVGDEALGVVTAVIHPLR